MAEVCSRRWRPPHLRDEATELLQELIRLDTTNPPGNETQAAELLRAYLEDAGVECELYARDPERANLVARIRGRGRQAPAPSRAHRRRARRSGRVVGRAVLGRAARRRDLGPRRARHEEPGRRERGRARDAGARGLPAGDGDLIFAATADEEVGTTGYGLSWLCDNHPDAVRAEYCVNEGGGDRVVVDGRPVYLCAVAEKMSSPFILRVRGRSGHASMPGIADNALVKAARAHRAARGVRAGAAALPETEAFLERLGRPRPTALGAARRARPAAARRWSSRCSR